MNTPTLDQRALLAAIVEHPDEDAPRLMLTDALQETGDEDDAFRAGYIRLAVEVAARPDLYDGTEAGAEARVLFALAERKHPDWRPACPVCEGTKVKSYVGYNPCNHCSGTGRVGTLRRGFLESVEVPALDLVLRDDEGMEWEPTKWGENLIREFPTVERVYARDRVPYWNGVGYCWYNANRGHQSGSVPESANLPELLFLRLTQHLTRIVPYHTEPAARDALASALTFVLKEFG